MTATGYIKPHYRVMNKNEINAYLVEFYHNIGCFPYLWEENNPSIIPAIKQVLSLEVIQHNNQYWVVTYPQGQVHA